MDFRDKISPPSMLSHSNQSGASVGEVYQFDKRDLFFDITTSQVLQEFESKVGLDR